MNSNRFNFLSLLIALIFGTNDMFADVTKTVGSNGADFTNLQLAFDEINNNIGGVYTGVVQLQIIDNTTETATAVLNTSANWTAIKIYPTVSGKSIEGDLNTPLITFNGANNVTIDGRLHNLNGVVSGSTNDLTISNANTGTAASTLFLTANASNNTVTYTTIKGASTGSNGTIMLTSPGEPDGMANNTFSYNLITGISASLRPLYSVLAKGTAEFLNKGNKIENNEFKDFLNLGAGSNAIYIDAYNDSWTISGNSFYESSETFIPTGTGAYTIVQIAGGPSHTVTENKIGGSAVNCVGVWTKNSTTNNNFTGISVVAASPTSVITNNVIKNIVWTSGTAAVSWKAIDVPSGAGDITITGNTVGAAIGRESIVVTNTISSSVYLIHIQNAGNAICENNTIGAIKTDNVTANNTSLYAIAKATNVTGNVSISSNIINNLTANSASTGTAQGLAGIFNNGGTGNITIDANTITNLVNNTTNATTGTASSTAGIRTTKGINVITNNSIHDLTNASANSAGTHQASVVGIAITGSAIDICTVNKNTIYNLSNTRSDFTGYVLGMHFVGKAGSVVSGNFIHSLSTHASATSAKLGGIRVYEAICAATFSNNIISLGSNTASSIIGIAEATALAANYNTNYYHNTINIFGTPTVGTSICYYSASTANLRTFKNNIFVNERSGGGTHYSFQTSATGLTSDYNLYYVSGTGSSLANIGGARADLTALQTASGGDSHSVNVNPEFEEPQGVYAFGYKTNSTVSLVGVTGTGVTKDFADVTRSESSPRMGAYETAVTTFSSDLKKSNYKIQPTATGILISVKENTTIELYNINGCLIKKSNVATAFRCDLNKGIYIIKINNEVIKFFK